MNTKSTLAQNVKTNSTQLPQQQKTFITAYGPKISHPLVFPKTEGRTKQEFKDECNINNIMARYMKTNVLDFVNKHEARYGDTTGMDYQDAMQKIGHAQSMFHDLPSAIRTKFKNDPALFLDFVHNPQNEAEMHEMGLMKPDYVPVAKRPPPPDLSKPQVTPDPKSADPKPDK